MDIQYIKEVTGFMSGFMSENGFSSEGLETGYFKNDLKMVKVAFSDSKREFSVASAPIDSDGDAGSYTVLATWFFDESDHGQKDTSLIADDFVRAVAADSGIKIISAGSTGTADVAMPEKAAEGATPGIEAFTQKFLALFPQYKDTYKDAVVKYGDFLYIDFFKNYGISKMTELLADEQKNKKLLSKYFDMLGSMHYEGDNEVGSVVCAVIIAGSFKGDVQKFNTAAEKYLEDYPFLKSAGLASVKNYNRNKKLRMALEG